MRNKRIVGLWAALVLGCGSSTSYPAPGGIVFGPAEPLSLPVEMPRFERSVDGFVVGGSAAQLRVNDARIGWKWLDSGEQSLSVGLPSIDGSGPSSAFSLNGDGRSLSRKVGDGVETIEPHARGVEARWRFERRPTSQGDLVVRWPVGADVSSVVRIDSGVKVEVTAGVSRVATDGVWVDAKGTRVPVVVAVEAGAFVWRVGSEVLEKTVFPADLDPIVGPGVELVPFVAGLPAPISNPRVASNGGKALIVWVDQPYVVTREAASSPVGAFVNVYRLGPVRLKGKLISSLDDVNTAPVIDFGSGPEARVESPASPDRYDNLFRVVPVATGFAVAWCDDSAARLEVQIRRVMTDGTLGETKAIKPAAIADDGSPARFGGGAQVWDFLPHGPGAALVGNNSALPNSLVMVSVDADLAVLSTQVLTGFPRLLRGWAGASFSDRGVALFEQGGPESWSPRALFLVSLPTSTQAVVTRSVPFGGRSECGVEHYGYGFCGWGQGWLRRGQAPVTVSIRGPEAYIDAIERLARVDLSAPPTVFTEEWAIEPGIGPTPASDDKSPQMATLCPVGTDLVRLYENTLREGFGGPRGLQVRLVGPSLVDPGADRPIVTRAGRFGPQPCAVLNNATFVVTRSLVAHRLISGSSGVGIAGTSSVDLQSIDREGTATHAGGGRHGLVLVSESRGGVASSSRSLSFSRRDLLGRRIDVASVSLERHGADVTLCGIASTESAWWIASHVNSGLGSGAIRLHRITARGVPTVSTVEVGPVDLRTRTACRVAAFGGSVHLYWLDVTAVGPRLNWRSYPADGGAPSPLRSMRVPETPVDIEPMSVVTYPGGGLLFTGGADETGTSLLRRYRLSLAGPVAIDYPEYFRNAAVERPTGWAGIGSFGLVYLAPNAEPDALETFQPAAPVDYVGAGPVAWDGVGVLTPGGGNWNFVPMRIDETGIVRAEVIDYPARPTATGRLVPGEVALTAVASTWGGVSLATRTLRVVPDEVLELTAYPFHRTAAVTADHLERTLTQNAAHALTLGPTTHTDGTAQTFEIHVPPLHGTATLAGNIATYRSNPEYVGEDSFFFTATGADGSKRAFTVLLDVTAVDDPPTGSAQTIDVNEDETAEFDTTAIDPEGATTTIRISTPPAHGTLVRIAGNRFAYSPASDFNGDDTATLVASDGTQDSAAFSIRFVVAPVNDPPVLESRSTSGDEDTTLSITLAGTDVDGDTLTYTLQTAPALGLTTITGSQLRFVPPANFNGPVSAVVRALDPTGAESGDATFTFDVLPANDAPVVQDDAFAIDEDSPFDAPPLVADVDDATSTLAIELTGSAPVLGAVSIVGRQLRYSPNTNAHGIDTFRYRMRDASGAVSGLATRTVTIRPINDAPDALDGRDTVVAGGPIELRIQASDVDGDALSFVLVTPPANGTAIPTATGFTYECDRYASTPDSFTFRARDPGGLESPIRTFQLSRRAAQRAPVVLPIEVTGTEDSPVTITLLGTDADGDPITYERATSVEHGAVTIDGALATFTPDADWNGTTTFRYHAFDGALRSVPALVTVRIANQNDVPVATPLALTLDEDTTLDLTLFAQDLDADTLTFAIDTPPAVGTLTGTPPNLTFTPPADFHGEVTFTFTASDATTTSEPATVTLSVHPVADTPIALARTGTGLEDASLRIEFAATDADGDALTFAIDTPPDHGTLVLDPTGATFTPDHDWSGTTSFTYTSFDGALRSAPAQVTLTITPVNDPPTAPDTRVTLDEDRSAAFTLVGSDPEGASLTWSVTRSPTRGTLEAHGSGAFTYSPNPDSNGLDQATFIANDGVLDSAPVTVVFLVQALNDAPVLPDVERTQPQGPVAITLVSSDVDGPDANWNLVLAPAAGTLTGELPEVTWTPPDGFVGDVSFVVSVSDGSASDEATVRITIVNAPPDLTVSADAQEVEEGTPLRFTATATDPGHDPLTLGWSFGDDATATGPEVTHAFANEGTYTVACTVEDGHVSVTRTLEVVVRNAAPVLVGIDSPAEVNEAAEVVFVATANDPGSADDLSITWSFGDGASGQGASVRHTFADNGTFEVVATVRDPSGSESMRSRTVLVRNVAPEASPVSNIAEAPIGVPIEVTLLASDVAGAADPLSWRVLSGPGTVEGDVWRFVPGRSEVGGHEVTLEVSDGDEGVDSVSFVVDVAAPAELGDGGSDTPVVPEGCGCGASNALGLLVALPLLRRRTRS